MSDDNSDLLTMMLRTPGGTTESMQTQAADELESLRAQLAEANAALEWAITDFAWKQGSDHVAFASVESFLKSYRAAHLERIEEPRDDS